MTSKIDAATKASIEKWEMLRRAQSPVGVAKRIRELEAEVARLTAVETAARALIMRMEEIYEHPAFQSVWTVNQLHAGPYKGPKWDVESNTLKAALLLLPTTEPAKAEEPLSETLPTEHKWLDPECGLSGCQSLVWKSRYESAVKGRADFRNAFRKEREGQAERAEHEVARLTAAREWQPIDTAPKDGKEFLAWCFERPPGSQQPERFLDFVRWTGGDPRTAYFASRSGAMPTHWMSLPDPPSLSETAEQQALP